MPEINQVEDIQTYHLGGYVLFGRDTENETAETLKQKIADYQQASSIPLLDRNGRRRGNCHSNQSQPCIGTNTIFIPSATLPTRGWQAIKKILLKRQLFSTNMAFLPVCFRSPMYPLTLIHLSMIGP